MHRPDDLVRADAVTPLEEYAAALSRPSDGLLLRAGQSADVLMDAREGLVWRFPRTETARDRLPEDLGRLRRARDLGLPAPEPVRTEVQGESAWAHLVMRFVPGVGLHQAAALLHEQAARQLAGDLASLLLLLRGAPLDAWPAQKVRGPSTGRA